MPFFATVNLVKRTLTPCEPWNFRIAGADEPGAQVRHDKDSRQAWYQNIATRHNFYTAIESSNPNQRSSEDNPPTRMNGAIGDFDLRLSMERVLEAIEAMELKPAYIERSLGGNVRLVWIFPRSLPVGSMDFCIYLLQKMRTWLRVDLLPGLDAPSFEDPNRLFCNGGEWTETGHGPIDAAALQAFFVKAGREYRFKSADIDIPMEVVENALKAKYPNFAWPSSFEVDSQGPSFWVEGSESPLSAIVKKEGMFTFSAHADKPFYTWADLLGAEFVKAFSQDAIAKATADVWFDGHHFWRKLGETYVSCESTEMDTMFKVECGLSSKAGKNNYSTIEAARMHIYNYARVVGAAPFVFRPPGAIEFMGKRRLNTFVNRVVPPIECTAEEAQWGPKGKFPWISNFLDNLFETHEQRDRFLAWFKHFYINAWKQTPKPGQNIFLCGGPGTGKTLLNRAIVGGAIGGFADASAYLIRGAAFNSDLIEEGLWCSDDDSMTESSQSQLNFQAMLKKITANQEITHNKKFEVACMTEWMGRIICTINLDYVSSRALGSLDNTSLDKTCVFRCVAESKIVFPDRYELAAIIKAELPYFLRWLVTWDPPAWIQRDSRFGYVAYQDPSMLDQAQQGSKVAPFKELLTEALDMWFDTNKQATEYRGSVTAVIRLITSDPRNESVIRSLRLEQTARYLEMIQREGVIKCSVENGSNKTRTWIFYRSATASVSTPSLPPNEQPKCI